jgi:hypothetical protein
MNKLLHEYCHFHSHPGNMRILLITKLFYALVLPVVDISSRPTRCAIRMT